MKFNNKNTNKNQEGLSLIETMVALGVMVVGLLGGLMLATYALSYVKESRNRMIASNLVQEGIEVVRSQRDSNWLEAETDWLFAIPESNKGVIKFNSSQGMFLGQADDNVGDFNPEDLETIKNFPVVRIFDDSSASGIFRFIENPPDSAIFSGFYRVITTKPIGDDKLLVVCYVGWERRGKIKLVQAEEHLYNWRHLPESP